MRLSDRTSTVFWSALGGFDLGALTTFVIEYGWRVGMVGLVAHGAFCFLLASLCVIYPDPPETSRALGR